MIDKEEILEVEEKIEKALQKEKETSEASKQSKPAQTAESVVDKQKIPLKAEHGDKVSPGTKSPPPKIETQTTIVPPPYNSIDPNKKNNTKTL